MKQYLRNGVSVLRLSPFSIDLRKVATLAAALICAYFIMGDVYLYLKVQSTYGRLPFKPGPNETFPCYSSPFCSYSVKTLFLDFPNFYIFLPISTMIYHWFHSTAVLSLLTPNIVSVSHVFVAIIAGKCVVHDSLYVRQAGVFVYQLRNLLDTTDGTMARARAHLGLSSPQDRYIGYYVDGICDALGCIALVLGCYVYINRHPTRLLRPYVYSHLPVFVTSRKENVTETEHETEAKVSKGKSSTGSDTICGRVALWFLLQSLVSSLTWNSYIEKFSVSLETVPVSEGTRPLQGAAATSTTFWILIELWRLVNPQAMFQFLCAAIVMDRTVEFLSWIQYYGYVGIVTACLISEVYYKHIHLYAQF